MIPKKGEMKVMNESEDTWYMTKHWFDIIHFAFDSRTCLSAEAIVINAQL